MSNKTETKDSSQQYVHICQFDTDNISIGMDVEDVKNSCQYFVVVKPSAQPLSGYVSYELVNGLVAKRAIANWSGE